VYPEWATPLEAIVPQLRCGAVLVSVVGFLDKQN